MQRGAWYVAVCVMMAMVHEGGKTAAEEALDGQDALHAQEVVVSATKTPLPISRVTSAIEVIPGEELDQKKLKTVVDALRLAQGLTVFSSGGPGTNATARIRGASSAHTLVLIDGAIVNSPTSGDFNFANLMADNIDRIEILRGAQSMLYGSDAMGGVINIITRRGVGPLTGSAFVEYGSFASLREGGQVSGTAAAVDYAFSFSRWDTSSLSAANYRRGATERDGYHNWQGSGRVGVALPKDGRLDVAVRWWNADVSLDSVTTTSKFDVLGSRQTTRTLIFSAFYDQPLTSWWSQRLTLGQNNERLLFDGGTVRRNIETHVVTAISPRTLSDIEILNRRVEWQHNISLGKPLLLSAGYQFRDEHGDNTRFQPQTAPTKILSSHAGYVQAQAAIEDRVLLTAGLRHDRFNTFGDATTYRLTGGYLYPETGTKIRGSYATGFRAPTINQLFFPGFGNPDLQPEQTRGWDVGIDQLLANEKILVTATYFHNRFENLIQLVPAGGLFRPENVGEAITQGWEAAVKVDLLPTLSVRGQYTHTLTRDLQNGRRLARIPVDQASLGLWYQPIPPLQFFVDYRFVGARNNDSNSAPAGKLGSFGVINASATFDVTRTVQLFGRVENLGNQEYEEILGYGTPIQSIFGGFRISL